MRLAHQQLQPVALRVQEGDLSPDAQAAWRHLRDQGGWYTATELGAELMPQADKGVRSRSAGRWLAALVRRGHAVRREWTDATVFGVTHRCFPIPGESIDPAPITTDSAATA